MLHTKELMEGQGCEHVIVQLSSSIDLGLLWPSEASPTNGKQYETVESS